MGAKILLFFLRNSGFDKSFFKHLHFCGYNPALPAEMQPHSGKEVCEKSSSFNRKRKRAAISYRSRDNHFSICAIELMRGSRHSAQPAMLDCRCFKGPNRCLIGQHYYLTPDLRTVPLSRLLPLRIAAAWHLSIPRIMPSNHANSLVICAESVETNKRN